MGWCQSPEAALSITVSCGRRAHGCLSHTGLARSIELYGWVGSVHRIRNYIYFLYFFTYLLSNLIGSLWFCHCHTSLLSSLRQALLPPLPHTPVTPAVPHQTWHLQKALSGIFHMESGYNTTHKPYKPHMPTFQLYLFPNSEDKKKTHNGGRAHILISNK